MLATDRPRRAEMTPTASTAIPDTPVTSKPVGTVAIGRMAVGAFFHQTVGSPGSEAEVFEEGEEVFYRYSRGHT